MRVPSARSRGDNLDDADTIALFTEGQNIASLGLEMAFARWDLIDSHRPWRIASVARLRDLKTAHKPTSIQALRQISEWLIGHLGEAL